MVRVLALPSPMRASQRTTSHMPLIRCLSNLANAHAPMAPPPKVRTPVARSVPLVNHIVPAELIKKKREGKTLSESEIFWIVNEFHKKTGAILDYQMSAFLMAACVKGMNEREAMDMTNAMISTASRGI